MTANTSNTSAAPWLKPYHFKPGNTLAVDNSWVLTDAFRAVIVEAASKGRNYTDIAALVGVSTITFKRKRDENPEIDELIELGKTHLRTRLLDISFSAITSIRDPARNQELARLHRIAKTEEARSVEESDDQSAVGFTVKVIPNKTSSNTAS